MPAETPQGGLLHSLHALGSTRASRVMILRAVCYRFPNMCPTALDAQSPKLPNETPLC